MITFELERARQQDIPDVAALYGSAIGREGCTWNEYYPTAEDAERDWLGGGLRVLRSGGSIIGALSVVPENELDELACWFCSNPECIEIARVVIAPAYQGQGLAEKALRQLFASLSAPAVHLLAARRNGAALETYRRLGFCFCGECEMYDNEYYACELLLTENRTDSGKEEQDSSACC